MLTFAQVKAEIKGRLDDRRKRLSDLGEERNSSAEQSIYLTKLATKFQRLVSLALNATHGADNTFEVYPELCIAPTIMARMKAFSEDMAKFGETYSFISQEVEENDPKYLFDRLGVPSEHTDSTEGGFEVRKEADFEELADILHPSTTLAPPQRKDIRTWIDSVFQGNRGFELGTFNASILATAMKKQSFKWKDISLGFVSDVIVVVHDFINTALASICSDRNVRDALNGKLSDELIKRYEKAISNTNFLLAVENSDTPMTLNHYFNDNLQKR